MSLSNPAPPSGSQRGLMASVPREYARDASCTSTAGRVALSYFTANRTATFTSLRMRTGSTAAAATPTLVRFGIYSITDAGDGTLLAATVSDTAVFAATNTAYSRATSTSFTVTAGQRYACAVIIVTASATPTLNGNIHLEAAGAGLDERLCGFIATQTDLPSTFASAGVTDTTFNYQTLLIP